MNYIDEPKKQFNRVFIDELVIKLIMDCRTKSAHTFRTRLGFKQYNVILTKKTISAHKNNEFISRGK